MCLTKNDAYVRYLIFFVGKHISNHGETMLKMDIDPIVPQIPTLICFTRAPVCVRMEAFGILSLLHHHAHQKSLLARCLITAILYLRTLSNIHAHAHSDGSIRDTSGMGVRLLLLLLVIRASLPMSHGRSHSRSRAYLLCGLRIETPVTLLTRWETGVLGCSVT